MGLGKIFQFVFLLVLVVSCGGGKTENKPETAEDSGTINNDQDISSGYGAAADGDVEADVEPTDGDDDTAGEDKAADSDETADEDVPADDASSADADDTDDSGETTDAGEPLCDIENGAAFTKQPEKMNVAPKNRSVLLSSEAEAEGCTLTYQWYESADDSTESGTAVQGATNTTFETPVFTKKGVHYYYCAATATNPEGESRTFFSKVASVAYTGLPTLYVNTPGGVDITSKEEWVKNTVISLAGADDESWNFENVGTSIRGRGNSTWNRPKKPYNLKLKEAHEIMGMPEHKRWVLLANYYDGSFMRNVLAFYFSRLFELGWTVRGEFADLVLNGRYNGLYWIGEAVKVGPNRVDINDGNPDIADDEDKDYLVEMDLFYDETLKFKSKIMDLPYMIQNDDYMVDENGEITGGGFARLERLESKINALESLLYPDFTVVLDSNDCSAPDESYSEIIDIDSWIKFWLVNEIMDNRELVFPRSAFFTFDSANNIFRAGPVWDFDQAASHRPSSCQLNEKIYYNALFKSPKFVERTKELWNEYSGRIEIEPQIGEMRDRIAPAARYDALRWTGRHDYINIILHNDELQKFEEYSDFLKESVLQQISVVDSFIENL